MGDTKGLASTSQHQPATSEFVNKLFKILEDPESFPIISWCVKGDCLVVKDVNSFSKKILPPVYNHSNFASFVRQLNKYDFHKVRNPDDDPSNSHTWAFHHPDFRANGRDALGKIKRKAAPRRLVPDDADKREIRRAGGLSCSPPSSPSVAPLHPGVEELSNEIQMLRDVNEDLNRRLRIMEKDHRDVLVTLVDLQRAMVKQNELIHSANTCSAVGSCQCFQQSPLALESEYVPLQALYLGSQQQAQFQAPDAQQSRYDATNGGFVMSSGGPSSPSGAIYTPECPGTYGIPIEDRDTVQLPSTCLPTSHPSSPWILSPTQTYSTASQAMGHDSDVSDRSLSPNSPGGPQGGLSNVGMDLDGASEATGDGSPYFMWSTR